MKRPPSECPVCGAAVPRGATSCPECGADERTGWDEEATRYDGLNLPAEAFDEPNASTPRRRIAPLVWWLTGALLLLALGLRFGGWR